MKKPARRKITLPEVSAFRDAIRTESLNWIVDGNVATYIPPGRAPRMKNVFDNDTTAIRFAQTLILGAALRTLGIDLVK